MTRDRDECVAAEAEVARGEPDPEVCERGALSTGLVLTDSRRRQLVRSSRGLDSACLGFCES
jgi:hypothetical protein